MSYQFYKILHFIGIISLFISLGGHTVITQISKKSQQPDLYKFLMRLHGMSLLVVLVGGFGLMARLSIGHTGGWPTWLYVKLALWLVFGGIAVLLPKLESLAMKLLCLLALAAITVITAVYKY